ncbi:hypothetical protein BLNAU_5035 [Blattamonas nauphoetae]|uniref:Protein kinase A anchor protein nuclear localisation signal domain-containing protein n=1 Tax=Blattamonas nauphoetae TaxID=2049346 RepID=A0ABQ9Y8R6_9EUKA|nr:hypothetical protein BLNAU_5035 [Blattamonas nauphoetae]
MTPQSFLRTLLGCWECVVCWCRRTDSGIASNRPETVCSFGFVVLNAAVFDCHIVNRPLSKQFLSSLNDTLRPDYLSQSRLLTISKTHLTLSSLLEPIPRQPSEIDESNPLLTSLLVHMGVNCIARRLIRPNSLPPLNTTLSTRTGVIVVVAVVGVVGEHQVWEVQMSEEDELLHRPRAWTEQPYSQFLHRRLKNGTSDC